MLSGTILEAFLEDYLSSRAKCKNSKKPRKTNGFSSIFEVLGGSGARKIRKKTIKVGSERLRGGKSEPREAWGG